MKSRKHLALKLVSTMSSWDEFTSSRAETLATEQAAANLNVFIDQRMGELIAALPTKQGRRNDLTSLPMGNEVTKTESLEDAGLTPKTASQLEQLAANEEVSGRGRLTTPFASRSFICVLAPISASRALGTYLACCSFVSLCLPIRIAVKIWEKPARDSPDSPGFYVFAGR